MPERNLNTKGKTENIIDMAKVRITKTVSTIEKDERQKRTMRALGLNKIGDSNELENNAAVAGMIRKVLHLVKVENI
jgi:large subunit ribosomal protein L30